MFLPPTNSSLNISLPQPLSTSFARTPTALEDGVLNERDAEEVHGVLARLLRELKARIPAELLLDDEALNELKPEERPSNAAREAYLLQTAPTYLGAVRGLVKRLPPLEEVDESRMATFQAVAQWSVPSNYSSMETARLALEALEEEDIEPNLGLMLPPLLTFLDAPDPKKKVVGCYVLQGLVGKLGTSLLDRTGVGKLLLSW
ncbi:poly A polymerase C-terminal region-like protein [Pseudohyphozyma bogoriensis]|nr:poly A polymerase C-terminal region-like protein [Pseudohyphozyma bogoriensis]